jgi:hypothetical protein
LVIRKWNLECKIGGGYAKMARTYTLEIFGKLIVLLKANNIETPSL